MAQFTENFSIMHQITIIRLCITIPFVILCRVHTVYILLSAWDREISHATKWIIFEHKLFVSQYNMIIELR